MRALLLKAHGGPKDLELADVAGAVEAAGSGVAGFVPGDEVWGCTDARLLAHKPAAPSMREAAALPLVPITAWARWS